MATEDLVVVTNVTVTEDESAGTQNSGTPVLSGGLVVEDSNDSDTALSGLNSMPFSTRLFGPGGLNLSTSSVIGLAKSSGNAITINAGAGLQDVAFTDANGDPLAGVDSGLYTDSGQKIFLYTDVENNIVLGRVGSGTTADPNGAVAFAVVLNETKTAGTVTGGEFWVVQFQPLSHSLDGDPTTGATATISGAHDDLLDLAGRLFVKVSQEILFTDFSKAPSTASDWTGIAPTGSTADVQILITGRTPVEQNNNQTGDVVQTSNIGVGTNSQSVDPGEGLRIDFVSGLNLPPKLGTGDSKDIDGINYTAHMEEAGAGFKLVQVQGSAGSRTDAKITIFNTDDDKGNQFVPSLHVGELAVNIGRVQVLDANGKVVESTDGSADDANITISVSGSSVVVTGLLQGYSVLVRSVIGTKFDRMLIENVGTGTHAHAFDVGGVRLLDGISDVDDVGASIRFEDDGPGVTLALAGTPVLTLDETGLSDGTISTSGTAAALFSTSTAFGADGAAASGSSTWSLTLSSAGADSGLDDTATGSNVLLYLESGDVVGRAGSASGAEVFRVHIDASTGAVTLSQSRAIVHDDPADPDESSSPAAMVANLIKAQRSVLDGDGDTASASVSISQLFKFEDDGPSATLSVTGTPSLTLDETDLSGGAPITTSASAASLFGTTAGFGADGPAASGASAWSMALSTTGVDSGLDDSATGQNVLLYLESGQIVGRAGGASGAEVFRVSVNASTGEVTFSQSRTVVHDDPNDPDEASSPATMASGLFSVTRTLADGDGDTASASASVSQLMKFEDDGPSVSLSLNGAPSLTVDESGLTSAATVSANSGAASLFTTNAGFGADGAASSGSSQWALTLANAGADSGLDDSATGSNVLLYLESGQIVGRAGSVSGAVVFTVAIDVSTGAVTLTQSRAVMHDDPADPDEATSPAVMASGLFGASRTVTDRDGDHASAAVSISQLMKFEDDGPGVTLSLNGSPSLTVDETGLTSAATVSANSGAASLFSTTASFGADGAASAGASAWALTLADSGADSGLDDSATGSNVLLYLENGQIIGRAGSASGAVVFTVAVDVSTGSVTLTQSRAVVHDDPADPDEASSPAVMASGLFGVSRTVTDKDGDTASASVSISQLMNFEDDGPSVSLSLNGTPSLTVDETGLTSAATVSANSGAASLFSTTAGFGADGAASAGASSWALTLANAGADSGLDDSATGSNVLLYLESGQIVGRAGSASGAVVFTVAVDVSTGAVTLTQSRAVMHDDPNDADENTSPAVMASGLFGVSRTVTDKDGDSASASISISQLMKFEDDGPGVTLTVKTGAELRLDETGLTAGSPITTSGTAADLFTSTASFGADGAAASDGSLYGLKLSGTGADSGLDDVATGSNILLYLESGQIVGRVAGPSGAEAFRVSVDAATGAVTLSQSRALKHPDATDPDEASAPLTLSTGLISVERTVTDRDGDHSSASADIGGVLKFEDDGPSAFSPDQAQLSNAAGQTDTAYLDYLGQGGADGLGGIVFNGVNGSLLTGSINGAAATNLTSGGAAIYLYGFGTGTLTASTDSSSADGLDAAKTVFTIALNPAGDAYAVNLVNKIDNGSKIVFSDFSKAPSTASDWTGIAPTGSTADVEILITGRTPVELNNNQTGDVVQTSNIGVGTNSQSVDSGEGLRIDFVSGLNLPPKLGTGDTKDIDGINYSTHFEISQAAFQLVQVQGSAKTRTDARVTLFNTDDDKGNQFVPSLHTGEVAVNIGVVKVLNAAGQVVESSDGSVNDKAIVITVSGASATVTGLLAGYSVQVTSAGGAKFDRLLIENVNPSTKSGGFDVGGIVISAADAGSPIDMQFGLKLTDADGDSTSGVLDVLLNPPASPFLTSATTASATTLAAWSPFALDQTLHHGLAPSPWGGPETHWLL